MSSQGRPPCKTVQEKEQWGTTLSNTEPDTAVFQMPFPNTGDHQKVWERGSVTCRHSCTQRQLELQKQEKPKWKQERVVEERHKKQERGRNKCEDVIRWFSCPYITQRTVRYTAWSCLKCSILIMLFCQECLRWKELKLHLAFSAAAHLLSVEPGLLPGGQHGTFTTSSPRHALCSVHTVCLHADFALYQVGFISSNFSEFSGLPVSAKFVPVLFRMTNTAKMQQWFCRLEFRQRNFCESEVSLWICPSWQTLETKPDLQTGKQRKGSWLHPPSAEFLILPQPLRMGGIFIISSHFLTS